MAETGKLYMQGLCFISDMRFISPKDKQLNMCTAAQVLCSVIGPDKSYILQRQVPYIYSPFPVTGGVASGRESLTTDLLLVLFQFALGLLQFGFVVTYLSEPLVRGYTTAAAVLVLISQLKYVFGIKLKEYSGPLSQIYVSTVETGLRGWEREKEKLVYLCLDQSLSFSLHQPLSDQPCYMNFS